MRPKSPPLPTDSLDTSRTLSTATQLASTGFIALIVTVFALVCTALVYFCLEINERQLVHSKGDATNAIEARSDKIGTAVKDYAFWADAYDRTTGRIDLQWAYAGDNIGASLYETYLLDGVFIVGPHGATRYAVVRGELSNETATQWLGPELDALLAAAWEESVNDEPVQGFFSVNGIPAIVSAAVIRPSPEYADFQRLSVLIYVDLLNANGLSAIAQAFDLPGLQATLGAQDMAGQPSIVVQTALGEPVTFVWQVRAMGTDLLYRILPMLVVLGLAAALVVWYLRDHVQRAAQAVDRAQRALLASEQRFRGVSEASSDWIWETDLEHRLTYLSERFVDATGFPMADWLGRPLHELLGYDPRTFDTVAAESAAAANGRRHIRCELFNHANARRYCQLATRPITDGERVIGYRGTVCDVTDEIEAKARIEHLSQHDALTGLANRHQLGRYLSHRLSDGVSADQPIYLLVIDLDRFKPVNDTLGHAAGDFVLREVAKLLKSCVRDTDMVARLGGDEFVVVINGCVSADQATMLCDRILDRINQPLQFGGQDINVGASIGIAAAPHDGTVPDDLLRFADIALYEAKAAGRNTRRFYEPTMNQRILERRRLETDLRNALRRKEFVLDYQPRFDATSQRLMGAEALVRWNHPEQGRIQPMSFIPVAEESGLIVELSDWVLRTACSHAVSWEPGLIVSVNLSPLEFQRDDLVSRIERVLVETAIDPSRLELELTENVLLDDAAGALDTMTRLKRLGVRLSMDDFGTGYSSLSYLRTYPFDCLKIDRSFVSNIDASGSDEAIVEAIVSMGRALSLTVVAEGIETASQLAKIAGLRCDQAQGFHLERPLSPERFAALRLSQPIASALPSVPV
ncbi:bifunctional diguanylate cyclase/phosphodiesterase [Pseudomonas sp. Marseille-QA0892]